jgi:plasmid stabilization system protein ParE
MTRPRNALTDRILVPLDGSDLSEAILPLVGAGEHAWGAEVLLVRTVGAESSAGPTAESEALDYLAARAQTLERGGLRVRCEVWHGDPSQTIVNAADLRAQHAGLGRRIGKASPRHAKIRWLVVPKFRNYIPFYQPTQDAVIVVRVLHAAQDWKRFFGAVWPCARRTWESSVEPGFAAATTPPPQFHGHLKRSQGSMDSHPFAGARGDLPGMMRRVSPRSLTNGVEELLPNTRQEALCRRAKGSW